MKLIKRRKKRYEQLQRIAATRFQFAHNGDTVIDVTMEQLYLIAKYGRGGEFHQYVMFDGNFGILRITTTPELGSTRRNISELRVTTQEVAQNRNFPDGSNRPI